MKRRKFLENLFKGTAGAVVTGVIANEIIETFQSEYPFVASGDINFSKNLISDPGADIIVRFDKTTKTIIIEPNGKPHVTLNELYRFLRDEWETDDELIPFKYPIIQNEHNFKGYYTI